MFGLHWLDLLVVVLYLAGITYLGMRSSRVVKTREDFFLGGRRFGSAMMAMHAFGTGTNTGQVASVVSKSYQRGMAGIWIQWMWMFATPFYWVLAPLLRRARCLTIADYYEERYGSSASVLAVLVGSIAMTLHIGLMLLGTGRVVQGMLDIEAGKDIIRIGSWVIRDASLYISILVMTVLFVLYSAAGGIVAAVRTDFVQGMFIIVLSALALPYAFNRVGNMADLRQKAPEGARLSALHAISVLPAKYRDPVRLVKIEEMPEAEAARRLGKTEDEVKELVQQGVNMLGIVALENLLFSVDLKFQSDLDGENISRDLRREFEDNQAPLSNNVTVSIEEKDNVWRIADKDNERTYIVRKGKDKLNIHDQEDRDAYIAYAEYDSYARVADMLGIEGNLPRKREDAARAAMLKAETTVKRKNRALPDLKRIMSLVDPKEISPFLIICLSINTLFSIVAMPHIMSVTSAGRTEFEGRFGLTYGNFLKRFCTVGWTLLAVCWLAYSPRLDHPDKAFGDAVQALLPVGLVGLMLASIMATAMSSCDSYMISIAALYTQNVYRRFMRPDADEHHYVNVARTLSIIVVVAAIAFAVTRESLVEALFDYMNITATIGIAFWLGIVWRRTNTAGVWASFITACTCWAISRYGLEWSRAAQIALYLPAGIVAGVLFSLLTGPPRKEQIDRFFTKLHTPIGQEENLEKSFDEAVPPDKRLITAGGLLIIKPALQTWLGFLIAWAFVALIIYGTWWLIRL